MMFPLCHISFALGKRLPKEVANIILKNVHLLTKPPSHFPLSCTLNFPRHNKSTQHAFPFARPTPRGVTISQNNQILITDYTKNRIHVFSSPKDYLRSFGSFGSNLGEFWGPLGITTDTNLNILICDSRNARIQFWTKDFKFLSEFRTPGTPQGVAIAPTGNILVTLGEGFLIMYSSKGEKLSERQVEGDPVGVSIDNQGNIIVACWEKNGIFIFDSNLNQVREVFHRLINAPWFTAVDSDGNFLVSSWACVLAFSSIGELKGEFRAREQFNPIGIAIDDRGNFVAIDEGDSDDEMAHDACIYVIGTVCPL